MANVRTDYESALLVESVADRFAPGSIRTAGYTDPEMAANEVNTFWSEWSSIRKRLTSTRVFFEKFAKTQAKGTKERDAVESLAMHLRSLEAAAADRNLETSLRTIGPKAMDMIDLLHGTGFYRQR